MTGEQSTAELDGNDASPLQSEVEAAVVAGSPKRLLEDELANCRSDLTEGLNLITIYGPHELQMNKKLVDQGYATVMVCPEE